jgi:tetratricopeptide (TPR) repeat protein
VKERRDHEERIYDLVEELGDERAVDLLHLLDCAACQGFARNLLRRERTGEPAPDYGGLLKKLEQRTPDLVRQMEAQTAEAKALMDRLLGHLPEERMRLAGTAEFRSLKLAELLLLESWGLQPGEPALSEELARLACRIGQQTWDRPQASARAEEVQARGSVLLANARRLLGDPLAAEDYFRQAAFHLTCPPDAVERAFYCQTLAALRRDQGREDEAAGLLWRATMIYNESSDLLEEGACQAELGFLFVAEDQAHLALPPLTRACEVLDLHADAALAVRARLALAVSHAQLGHKEKALQVLRSARPHYEHMAGSAREMAHVSWMEGKVAALTGNLEDAPGLLDTARKSFLKAGMLYDVGFVSLDLAVARARVRKQESIHDLIHDVVEGFPTDLKQAGVLQALAMMELAVSVGRPKDLEPAAAKAAEMLRRFRRKPLLVFEGIPRRSPAAARSRDSARTEEPVM